MKNTTYNDEQLVKMIQGGETTRQTALRYIYQHWRRDAVNIVRSQNISVEPEDAKDAVNDAVIEFDKKIRASTFKLTGALKGFFIALCKGRNDSNWRSKQASKKRNEGYFNEQQRQSDKTDTNTPESIMLQAEQKQTFERIFNTLEPTCIEVLTLYRLGHTSQEIADLAEADLKSAVNARYWIKKCRERLTDLIAKASYFKQ